MAGQDVSPAGIIANLSSFQHPQLGTVFGPTDIFSVPAWDVDPAPSERGHHHFAGGVPISSARRGPAPQ